MSYYLVVGLGKTGLSCARFLARRGDAVQVTDTRPQPPGASELLQEFPNIECHFGAFNPEVFLNAQALVVSPGVAVRTPEIAQAQKKGIPVLGDIQIFSETVSQKIIAITGTNGKSTVTSLVGLMLQKNGDKPVIAGNIGQAVLDEIDETAGCYVLELSSFQLETTTDLAAEIACILNLSPDHLDRYDGYADYVSAKKRIYQQAKHIVLNADDEATFPDTDFSLVSFTLKKPQLEQWGIVVEQSVPYLAHGLEKVFPLNEMKLKGQQNWQNALAATAIAYQYGASTEAICAALRDFPGLTHRCQWVRELSGVSWYNDSKGTNVGASLAAIQGLGSTINGKIVLLLGGQGKGGDFTAMNNTINRYAKGIIIFGEDADIIEQQITFTHKYRVDNLCEAIELAKMQATEGDIVLLSPACASFDMYQNFEARGEHFMQIVRDLS